MIIVHDCDFRRAAWPATRRRMAYLYQGVPTARIAYVDAEAAAADGTAARYSA